MLYNHPGLELFDGKVRQQGTTAGSASYTDGTKIADPRFRLQPVLLVTTDSYQPRRTAAPSGGHSDFSLDKQIPSAFSRVSSAGTSHRTKSTGELRTLCQQRPSELNTDARGSTVDHVISYHATSLPLLKCSAPPHESELRPVQNIAADARHRVHPLPISLETRAIRQGALAEEVQAALHHVREDGHGPQDCVDAEHLPQAITVRVPGAESVST